MKNYYQEIIKQHYLPKGIEYVSNDKILPTKEFKNLIEGWALGNPQHRKQLIDKSCLFVCNHVAFVFEEKQKTLENQESAPEVLKAHIKKLHQDFQEALQKACLMIVDIFYGGLKPKYFSKNSLKCSASYKNGLKRAINFAVFDQDIKMDVESFESLPEDIASERYLDEQIEFSQLQKATHDIISSLNQDEIEVLSNRYGFEDGHPKTLRETGEILGKTSEHTRQIEAKALKKLRHPSKSKSVREFV